MLLNPIFQRMGLLMFAAIVAFGMGTFLIRQLRKNLLATPEPMDRPPLAPEGLPVHAYHAVIQQLKQQKHELASQQLSDRRKAKATDQLSSTIFSDLPCGILFFNTSGLVRQANAAARNLLGFASPIGLHIGDIFRTATLRPESGTYSQSTIEQTLAPVLAGKSTVRGLLINYFARDGASQILELTASPVLSDDASLMGTTVVLTDKTEIERFRHELRARAEMSSDVALKLRSSLGKISGSAQLLVSSRDPEIAARLAASAAEEAAQMDRTISNLLSSTFLENASPENSNCIRQQQSLDLDNNGNRQTELRTAKG